MELLLGHEEPRKVARTGTISDSGRHYRVPDAYIGRRVWTRLKGDRLTIQVGRSTSPSIPWITSPAPNEPLPSELRAQPCRAASVAAAGPAGNNLA